MIFFFVLKSYDKPSYFHVPIGNITTDADCDLDVIPIGNVEDTVTMEPDNLEKTESVTVTIETCGP
ncbi:hypothetical protein [Nitrosopumilus sp.]|uniref:hypothetical protein n=1 Tax=Nitrosopumilus sp. TaxID=2024843 RepID=UPI003D0DB842